MVRVSGGRPVSVALDDEETRVPHSVVDGMRSALAGPRLVHACKVAVAAALAWLVIVPLGGVADEYPYYAPLGAVSAVAGTVASSLRATVSSIVAIALGAVPALVAPMLPGPGVLALAVVVLVGAWLAGWDRLGPSASWVPISGMFILIIGATDPWRFAGAYLGLVAIGAFVGLAVDSAWPALPLRSTRGALDRLRDTLAVQLRDLAEGLAADPLPTPEEWLERRHEVDRRASEMHAMVAQAREAQRVNWRATRWRQTADSLYGEARALEQLSFFIEDTTDLVARNEHAELEDVALGPRLRPVAARALEATADVLAALSEESADVEAWLAASSAVEDLAQRIVELRADTREEFFAAGALVSTLRRALEAVAPRVDEDEDEDEDATGH